MEFVDEVPMSIKLALAYVLFVAFWGAAFWLLTGNLLVTAGLVVLITMLYLVTSR